MKKIVIIPLLMILALCATVYATPSNLKAYYTMDNVDTSGTLAIDTAAYRNMSLYGGVTTGQTGKLSEGYLFDGTDGNMLNKTVDVDSSYSFSWWMKLNQEQSSGGLCYAFRYGDTAQLFGDWCNGNDELKITIYTASGGTSFTWSNDLGTTWHFYTVIVDNPQNNLSLYVDGAHSNTVAFGAGEPKHATEDLWISSGENRRYLDANYDDFCIWNAPLTFTNHTELYNSGNGKPCNELGESATAPTLNFSIIANNSKTGVTLTKFNATFNGTTYGTTTGQINTSFANNESYIMNITVFAQNFFNKTYSDYNLSLDLNATLDPGTRIYATDHYDGTLINFSAAIGSNSYTNVNQINWTKIGSYDFNITSSDHFNKTLGSINFASYNQTNYSINLIQAIASITPQNIYGNTLTTPFNLSTPNYYNNSNTLYLSEGKVNITWEKAPYKNATTEFDIIALYNSSLTITGIYQSLLNVTATDRTGTTITNFSINLTNSNYSTIVNTTNGSAIIQVLNENYNITIDNEDYELKTAQVNLTGDYTYNFSLYATNSINFTFKDEDTKNILSGINISMEIIGDVNYTNITTDTGSHYITLYYPEEYTIRYSADSYDERFYYFELTNRTYNQVTLYMSNSSRTSNITVVVYDEINDLVEGATVKAQKYDITTNAYNTVEMIKTNFEGEGVMNLEKDSEYYRFIIEYNGEIKKSTNPTYIYGDSINFQIILTSPSGEDFYNTESASWSLGFNNATNNFKFIFSDSDNAISKGCLYVYKLVADKEQTLYNSTCVGASSGTILIGVAAVNGTTYEGKSYIYYNNEQQFLGSEIVTFGRTVVSGKLGIFLIGILCVIFAMVGFWSPPIAAILTPVPILFGAIIGIANISIALAIPLVVLGIVIAVILSGRA
ncbi:hypothetical protein GF386_05305 [Candidatus Pacearchaeota archaeon]|nr:hypothetical protein [Candidatus Pacearchaeota archaeon]